jgi:cobalamin biosynthesis Mg chelatase CobN
MEYFQICSHPQNSELQYQAYVLYDNIVITNNGAEKYVVFRDEADWPSAEKSLDIVDPAAGVEREEKQLTLSHQKDCSAKMELLVFTQEELDAFAAAEAAKVAEEASREASKAEAEASKEASREQASIDASVKQSEEEAAAAAAENGDGAAAGGATETPKEAKTDDEGGSNMILIICIAGGGLVLVIVIILIAVTGKKKPEGDKKE